MTRINELKVRADKHRMDPLLSGADDGARTFLFEGNVEGFIGPGDRPGHDDACFWGNVLKLHVWPGGLSYSMRVEGDVYFRTKDLAAFGTSASVKLEVRNTSAIPIPKLLVLEGTSTVPARLVTRVSGSLPWREITGRRIRYDFATGRVNVDGLDSLTESKASTSKMAESKCLTVNIPFRIRPDAEIRQVRLYVSADQGATWRLQTAVAADSDHLVFKAPQDGVYWLRLAVVDARGKQQPEDIQREAATAKIVIDSRKPASTPVVTGTTTGLSGSVSFGLAYKTAINSAEGISGSIVLNEKNFSEQYFNLEYENTLPPSAAKAFETAEFYRRTGHLGSAYFYHELIRRRYPDTSYAKQSTRILAGLEVGLKTPLRIGQIFVRGNDKVSDRVILAKVGLCPGKELKYDELRAAEKKLADTGLFNTDPARGTTPTLTVIESDTQYKDIMIGVQEK